MLLVVPYPTHAETREAAANGNEAAKENLKIVEEREAFFARAEEHSLTRPSQLPDLEGDDLVIEWDFKDEEKSVGGDHWTVLRHEGKAIWREVAFYEGINRFESVLWILREKYGNRMAELRPAEASFTYLLGDDLRASGRVDSLNAELATLRSPIDDCGFIDVEDAEGDSHDSKSQNVELHSAIEQMGPIDCACDWSGDAITARINGDGRSRELFCPQCRRPLFRVSLDE